MPQLDKLIFYFEHYGFVVSFFSLIFYNQYFFYPVLLKNLFVRRVLIIKDANHKNLLNLFLKYKNKDFALLFKKINNLNLMFLKNSKKIFENFAIWLKYKYVKFNYYFNLFLNKFVWVFSYFFECYRSYIVEKY